MNLLRRLFNLAPPEKRSDPIHAEPVKSGPPAASCKEAVSRYYETMAAMQGAISKGDFDAAADAVRANLKFMPEWARAERADYGRFGIGSIPTIEQGGTILAVVGDEASLTEMNRIVAENPDLEPWKEKAEQSARDVNLARAIMAAVSANPGCLQKDLKRLIGEDDGGHIALLASYLARAGKLVRVKSGNSLKLLLPDSPEIPPPIPRREVASHRRDRGRPPPREIDITKLEYVPLPRAPLKWEEEQAGREKATVSPARELFEVRDANWTIESVDKLKPADRPDPSFRLAEAGSAGVFMVDDAGRAQEMGQAPASALLYDLNGRLAAKAPLLHDVYRLAAHPAGHGMIALSREGVLHAYDDELKPIIETALRLSPEIETIRTRFEIGDDELKNHIRCVALSKDASRYMFTVVDEAWCVSRDGRGLWGVKLPTKEGWSRVAASGSTVGTSAQVEEALKLMGLTLPFTPEELKSRFRTLAKKWHPDLNPGDPTAGNRMTALTVAAEVLTGIEAEALPEYTGARFAQELSRSTVRAGGMEFTFAASMVVSEKFASDWIYAAAFAAGSDGAYLAGYSGRVVQVDDTGKGVRVYDIGVVPKQIVDTGRFLYLLTYTRLYVIKEDALHAIVDTFDGGDLVVTMEGFGLLEKKRLRWHAPDGRYLGSTVTRDPIRRVFLAEDRLIVETRQARASIRTT